jgi:UDP-N-acetylmuramoyl-L-alanyl-D-glutamate--2,6-diaminopimelate ligase
VVVSVKGNTSIDIVSICNDSRKVEENALFVAITGFAVNGHDYIQTAIDKGAKAIICDDPSKISSMPEGVTFVQVEASRYAWAIAAANFYDNPSRKLTLVGITGTNGKTTTVTLLHRLFTSLGYSCGLLSTIANYVGEKASEAVNTTSDPLVTNSLLNEMVNEGCEYCFMEVSSIGVEQDRVAGLHFKAGIFSNLSHDHLDYHKTMDEYFKVKLSFAERIAADGQGASAPPPYVVCMDGGEGGRMLDACRALPLDLRTVTAKSPRFDLSALRLAGEYNRSNVLTAAELAEAAGVAHDAIQSVIPRLAPRWGRLELVPCASRADVYVDFAHTPDGLEKVLTAARGFTKGKLWAVFGAGGDRDPMKRPLMGAACSRLADYLVVTSDNPRSEDPNAIIADILKGVDKPAIVEVDRAAAIRLALSEAQDGDVVIVCGKGHETTQEIAGVKHPFDDREVVRGYRTEKA